MQSDNLMQSALAASEGCSEGVEGEGGYNVASLEWKVDTAARGIERVCGNLG